MFFQWLVLLVAFRQGTSEGMGAPRLLYWSFIFMAFFGGIAALAFLLQLVILINT
jgi:hypothetical protein